MTDDEGLDRIMSGPAQSPGVLLPASLVRTLRDHLEQEDGFVWLDQIKTMDEAIAAPSPAMLDPQCKVIPGRHLCADSCAQVGECLHAPKAAVLDPVTVEACAKFIEQNQETIRETSNGSERYLSPRKVGNLAGIAYVDGIRALAGPVPSTYGTWQPIETAPKDYSVVMLYQPAGPGNAEAVGQGHRSNYYDTWIFQASGWRAEPTHWMPLPEPPSTVSSKQSTGD